VKKEVLEEEEGIRGDEEILDCSDCGRCRSDRSDCSSGKLVVEVPIGAVACSDCVCSSDTGIPTTIKSSASL
jgi:hypothetical protein